MSGPRSIAGRGSKLQGLVRLRFLHTLHYKLYLMFSGWAAGMGENKQYLHRKQYSGREIPFVFHGLSVALYYNPGSFKQILLFRNDAYLVYAFFKNIVLHPSAFTF